MSLDDLLLGNLNDLLRAKHIDPKQVLVLRHRPPEPELDKALFWLAAEKPDLFNAYQQTQGEKLEKTMEALKGAGYVASFIGHEPGKALFVGLYSIVASRSLSHEAFWNVPAYVELQKFGMQGPKADRKSILWFDLTLTDFYAAWKGKLIVGWPAPAIAFARRAHLNEFPVRAVLEDNAFVHGARPKWEEIDVTWEQLRALPKSWKSALAEWRGIYYIFDVTDGKGYVGSAYGDYNLLQRWENYAKTGHGGNRLLLRRDPHTFRFTILQRISPDADGREVTRLESTWKERLHTRSPHGLNDN